MGNGHFAFFDLKKNFWVCRELKNIFAFVLFLN